MELKVYGAPWCPDCRRTKQFLGEHRVPYEWIDIDADAAGAALVREKNQGKQIIPTVLFPDGSFLAEPSNAELAERLGLVIKAKRDFYDLVVVGGGPAGLVAAMYAAREGIQPLILERGAPGGQAGITERVDNYPGFPRGIGGKQLAERMVAHARRYGVEIVSAVAVNGVSAVDGQVCVTTERGEAYRGRAGLVATGTSYRRLGVPGEDDLIGAGVHFCATCDGPFYKGADELMVIGGGNSGVEEGLFLTQFANRIRLVEMMPRLGASALLQEKAGRHPRLVIHTNTSVVEFRKGRGGRLGSVLVRDRATGEPAEFKPAAVFVFIGLSPNTHFLKGILDLDPQGFILTDGSFETSLPGVYAAGDVRSGSTKQLASAAGEAAAALLAVRRRLQQVGDLPARTGC